MTVEEIKKLDKKVLEIEDPLGSGLPVLKKLFKDFAVKKEVSVGTIAGQYMRWKWSKT